ncbi:MAG TPA: hypothetical protein VIA62_26025 [Thermoanaerobaculia bacterium]|jgi:hypothetical protein|nr:hypothetical protein [Thermoanaerobaculia bacterium]
MTRILRLSLVLTLVLCCPSGLALAAGSARPAGALGPLHFKSPTSMTPLTPARTQGTSLLNPSMPRPTWLADSDPDCESACSDQFMQCCTYGGCEQCSCQLALCRASCGDPWYGC